MKKFRLMMMAGLMAFASAASAEGTVKCFYTDPVLTFEEGAEQADLKISMDYDAGEDVICTWQFELYLPAGIDPIYNEDDEEWLGEVSAETNRSKFVKNGLKITKKADGGYIVLGFDDGGNKPMTATKGLLCVITVSGNSTITGTGKIVNTALGNNKDESVNQGNFADFVFSVNGGDSQGINDIIAAESNAPAYNLQGIRVNSEAKGLIIRDGKKQIVK